MPYGVRIHRYGGPEVLRSEQVEVRDPGPGELRLRQNAIGVNSKPRSRTTPGQIM